MAYSQKAVNDYHKRNYYRLNVTFPKDYETQLKDAANKRGVSVSRFISDLVGRELGLDLALDGVFPGAKGQKASGAPADGTGSDGEGGQGAKK